MPLEPRISCLCITRNRVNLLKRAIAAFKAQTYLNKELFIVYEDDDPASKHYLTSIDDPHIINMEIPASDNMTLGRLRNEAISACNGDYFCQWDDDDWYHHQRLEVQMGVILESNMPATVLLQWLIYDGNAGKAYVSCSRPWEGSLLCKTSLIADDLRYDESPRGEDTTVVKKLFARHLVFPMIAPKLYIYNYHGDNVWDYDHWRKIFDDSAGLSRESTLIIKDILDGKYSCEEASALLDQIKG